jgi:Gas vesicle synthesis protein GvpL/GvpF
MARALKSKKDDKVLYLYGITKSSGLATSVKGVDDVATIETITCGGLVCWISRVSRTEFADNLSKNIENLDWLAAMSVRHQRAASAIAEPHDILPARFGTIFVNEASLCRDIKERKALLETDFKRIEGSQEWGIKVFRLPEQARALPAKVRTGKDYLQAKSTLMRKPPSKESDQEMARFAAELESISESTAGGGSISGGRRDLLYQVSLLLKRTNRQKLQALLERFSRQWKHTRNIECTGPWPPYSFVSRSIQ